MQEPSSRAASMFAPLFFGALSASTTEAVQAAVATGRAELGARAVAVATWQAFGIVLLPSLGVAALVALVFSRPEARSFTRHLRLALLGPRLGARGGILPIALLVVAALIGVLDGRAAAVRLSANVAVTLAALETLGALVGLAIAVAFAARMLGPRLAKLEARVPPRVRWVLPGATPFLWAAASTGAFLIVLPPGQSATVSCGAFGLAFATLPTVRAQVASAFRGARGAALFATFAVVAASAPLAFAHVSPPVRTMTLYRAPVAGAILSAARDCVDADRDGYSTILGGGDCNDHDASIHPNAHDIPGNHIDEDCSGYDATPFVPVRQPPVLRPTTIPTRPNIVLVQMDALRPDHLSFAGYARHTSPKTDEFRSTATWFDHAYSPAPMTRFAMAMLFTGQDVDRIPQKRGKGVDFDLLPGLETLATRLGKMSYDRVGYTITYVMQHIHGLGQGFRVWDTAWPMDDWQNEYPTTATHTTTKALEYLGTMPQDGSKPFFLFLHYRCTHDPYAKNARWDFGSSTVDEYDSAVAYCDDELGRLLQGLDARADKDRTAIVVFSDHGELFGEHGFTHHGNTLSEPDVRSLLLARIPGVPLQPTVHEPVSLMDLEPTLLMLAGAAPDGQTLAWNLLPLITGGDAAGRADRPIFLYQDLTQNTIRHEGRGVLVANLKYERDISGDMTALYDVDKDRSEENDLSKSLLDARAHMREMLESWEMYAGAGKDTKDARER